jgi:hypothetical protein
MRLPVPVDHVVVIEPADHGLNSVVRGLPASPGGSAATASMIGRSA